MPSAYNKGADQQAHVDMFVVRCRDSIHLQTYARSKISRLSLASVAEQASLIFTWLQAFEDRSTCDVAHFICLHHATA